MLTEQEFHQTAEQYLDMVYRIALNWFRRPADADDAVQETMLRLWRSETDFQNEDHLCRWLVRVTLNECRRISAHPWRKRMIPLEECPPPVFQDPAQGTLFQEVMALPAKYRLPLYLYYYEGYSAAEVGDLLGLKTSTVLTRLARGRAKLKTQLEEE